MQLKGVRTNLLAKLCFALVRRCVTFGERRHHRRCCAVLRRSKAHAQRVQIVDLFTFLPSPKVLRVRACKCNYGDAFAKLPTPSQGMARRMGITYGDARKFGQKSPCALLLSFPEGDPEATSTGQPVHFMPSGVQVFLRTSAKACRFVCEALRLDTVGVTNLRFVRK